MEVYYRGERLAFTRVAGDNTKNFSAHSACRQADGGAES